MNYQRNQVSALFYEQNLFVSTTSIQAKHGFVIYTPIQYTVHVCDLRPTLTVYYSKVGGDDRCWIGLYKSESDTSYYWLDGNNSTYRNWRSSKVPINENRCIHTINGEFRDDSCGDRYHYVCKGIYLFFKVILR